MQKYYMMMKGAGWKPHQDVCHATILATILLSVCAATAKYDRVAQNCWSRGPLPLCENLRKIWQHLSSRRFYTQKNTTPWVRSRVKSVQSKTRIICGVFYYQIQTNHKKWLFELSAEASSSYGSSLIQIEVSPDFQSQLELQQWFIVTEVLPSIG